MSFTRKRMIANPLPVRDGSRSSCSPANHADEANLSKTRPDQPWAIQSAFAADFTFEHSLPGPHTASIEILSCF